MRDVVHGSSAAVIVLVLVLVVTAVLGIALPLLSGGASKDRQATNWTPRAPTPAATQMLIAVEATQRPAGTSKQSPAPMLNSTPIASWSKVESTPKPPPVTSSPTAMATETPTSVPSPTATLAPTLRPSAAANTAQIPAGPVRPPTTPVGFAAAPKPPALVEPGPDETRRGRVAFAWQPTGPLLPGTAYEVVWWNRNEDPNSARGIAATTTATSLTADVEVLYDSGQATSNQIFWTVLVVRTDPYTRLTKPSDSARQITHADAPGAPGKAPPRPGDE
jgi:hypothetical protein